MSRQPLINKSMLRSHGQVFRVYIESFPSSHQILQINRRARGRCTPWLCFRRLPSYIKATVSSPQSFLGHNPLNTLPRISDVLYRSGV